MRTSRRSGRALRLMVAAIALTAAAGAGAAMPGLYFAGFYMDSTLAYSTAVVGEPTMEGWREEIWGSPRYDADVLDTEQSSFDRTDIGYSFGVGYQLTDYFAAELAYVQMGESRYSAIGNIQFREGGGVLRTRTDMRSRARGLGLSAIGIWPMGDSWALDARGGVLLGKKKVRYAVTGQNGEYDDHSLKDDSLSLMFGAGLNWSMSPGTAIRVGYTRLHQALYDKRSVNSWVLGLKYAW